MADDPRYGKPCGSAQLAKTLAVYDRADPAAARVIIVTGSDFEGTCPKLSWPETLVYSLPGAELNQMLTLVVAIKSEMPCEPELLLFAGMIDHLHAAGLLEQLKGDEPMPKKIWEAIQTLFVAMSKAQENASSRFGPKTKVVFTTSPGYASMPPALQFVYAILVVIAKGNAWRILMAAPNRELEPTNLRLRKSELAAAWADVSHALRGFYELAAESREMTVGRFVTAASEVTIRGFWREHAKGELRTRKDHEILKFLSPCWERSTWLECFVRKRPFSGPLCKSY